MGDIPPASAPTVPSTGQQRIQQLQFLGDHHHHNAAFNKPAMSQYPHQHQQQQQQPGQQFNSPSSAANMPENRDRFHSPTQLQSQAFPGPGSQGHGQGQGQAHSQAGGSNNDQSQKFSRSKGACQQCRAVKQRCSGASKHPCDRCQLYKLECIFSKEPPSQQQAVKPPKKAPAKQNSTDPETSQAVLHSLRVITERLRGIEDSLAAAKLGGSPTHVSHTAVGFDHDVKIPSNEESDPITIVTNAIKGLDNAVAGGSAHSPYSNGSDGSSPNHPSGSNTSNARPYEPDVPDAVSRGFVSVEEAQQLFDFFFTRCAQWVPPLERHTDRNMHHVRRRSTFLFHSILAVGSYFCYVPQGENGLRKYYAIVTTLVESLAPIVVSANPAELTVDLLIGLLICITWKPVRCGSEMQLGPAGFGQLQAHSKLNPSSGYVMGGLALRISQLLGLARRASAPNPQDRNSTDACRLWLWINLIDSRTALAEGKAPALDPADALRVTRLFASIKAKASDVRLAATVELYAAVVPIVAMQYGSQRTDFRTLYRVNAVIDRIKAYWQPLIESARVTGDPLACSFLNTFVPFCRVVLNADVLRTWLIRRKAETRGQGMDLENARFSLTSEEAHCLGFAVSAAEEILYFLSESSKTPDRGARHADWAQRDVQTGHRPPLKLDPEAARVVASAPDYLLLIIYAFPPLFLAQLRAQNLINCDLDMAPEITNDLYNVGFPSRALLPASKFMRLLELSAEFYEVVSPNNDFPAIPQAQLLRTMTCLSIPQSVPQNLQGYRNGELFTAGVSGGGGVSCMLPGALNALNGAGNSNPNIENSEQAKAHDYQMQQIASGVQPTNASLPYPYNTMVFSTEGADRLDQIMQSAVPDPLSSNSLLNSFARIDADWDAYFNHSHTPLDLYGGYNDVKPTMDINTSKLAGHSPDSVASLANGSASVTSPSSALPPSFVNQPLPNMGNMRY